MQVVLPEPICNERKSFPVHLSTLLTEPLKLIVQPHNLDAHVYFKRLGFEVVPQVPQLLYQVTQPHQLSLLFQEISRSLPERIQTQGRFCITRSPLQSQTLLVEFLDAKPLSSITALAKNAWFFRVLAQERLFFNYQPIFDLHQGEIVAYECLARACNEDGKEDFTGQQLLDAAVTLNLTHEFDDLALTSCLKALVAMERQKPFFINLLPNSIATNPFFLEQTLQQVKELGLQPHQITFELTEVEALLHYKDLPQIIHEFQSAGFGIAIDDLYGNVSLDHYFIDFRPDVIKVDRRLASGCSHYPMKQILVKNLLRSAHDLNIPVLVEGLEDAADIEFCRDIGVNYGQGFGLAYPNSALPVHSPNGFEALNAL
jgi:EAL domain-containing protein (putative c-di-GMP-specific phosphodiesterase class I)